MDEFDDFFGGKPTALKASVAQRTMDDLMDLDFSSPVDFTASTPSGTQVNANLEGVNQDSAFGDFGDDDAFEDAREPLEFVQFETVEPPNDKHATSSGEYVHKSGIENGLVTIHLNGDSHNAEQSSVVSESRLAVEAPLDQLEIEQPNSASGVGEASHDGFDAFADFPPASSEPVTPSPQQHSPDVASVDNLDDFAFADFPPTTASPTSAQNQIRLSQQEDSTQDDDFGDFDNDTPDDFADFNQDTDNFDDFPAEEVSTEEAAPPIPPADPVLARQLVHI